MKEDLASNCNSRQRRHRVFSRKSLHTHGVAWRVHQRQQALDGRVEVREDRILCDVFVGGQQCRGGVGAYPGVQEKKKWISKDGWRAGGVERAESQWKEE